MANVRTLTIAAIALSAVFHGVAANERGSLADTILRLAPPPANEALADIPEVGRRLLALRSYVRAGSKLADRWSWTEEKIKAFQGSPEQQALLAEVSAVSTHFSEQNPGYELYVNTRIRSLDVQIRNWNANESVGVAAVEILAAWKEHFGDGAPEVEEIDPEKLRIWLSGFSNTQRANLAAPGLTAHGRGHAIDFQVMKDGQIVAGADSRQIETVWRAEGWDVRLKESVSAAGPSFKGPLISPDEPWHFDYEPGSAAASDGGNADQ